MVMKAELDKNLPTGWEVITLKEISSLITKGTSPSSIGYSYVEEGVKFIKVESISKENKIILEKIASISEACHEKLSRSIIQKDDLLISIAGTLGRLGIVEEENLPANTNQALSIIRLKDKKNVKFIYYALQLYSIKKEIRNIATTGAQPNLSLKQVGDFQVFLPTQNERIFIVEILSKSEEQIEKTEQLIKKTKELKKGLMQHLLTKGIGHTEFKQTELGEIPLDWSLYNLSEVALKVTIGLVTTMTKFYVDTGSPLIRNSDIKEGKINIENLIKLDEDFAEKYKNKKLRKDDIVTVHTGDIGTSAIITEDMEGAHGFATLNTTVNKDIIHPEYLMIYFNSVVAKKQFYSVSTGDGRNNLNLKDFIKTIITVPTSLEEQKKIIDIFKSLDQQINSYEKEKEKQIKLKNALMQQLLTGEIRVTV